jgi:retron-type reverse transcriptase
MPSNFIRKLVWTFLAGRWQRDELIDRTRIAFRRASCPVWATQLLDRVVAAFGERVQAPRRSQLESYLSTDVAFQKRVRRWKRSNSFPKVVVPKQVMSPAIDRLANCSLPELTTTSLLAAWLSVSVTELDWFADLRRWERKNANEPLRHYRYQWISKKRGKRRLLECPKPRLKAIQRKLLDEILAKLPTHEAAHGFCRGRSVATSLQPHVGRDVVLTIDLRHFFPSVQVRKVNAIFRTIGYPEEAARILTGLCTNSVPEKVLRLKRSFRAGSPNLGTSQLYRDVHLPQGAPTSPALANLAAFRLDRRLTGLASKFGAFYTRYADDLTFSGDLDFGSALARFQNLVRGIIIDEGFELRYRKTRVMTQGHRQQVTGLVLNEHLNVQRKSYDTLKAILYNSVRLGPSSQNLEAIANFDAHLRGRIAWVNCVNAVRGAKLQALYEKIDWDR